MTLYTLKKISLFSLLQKCFRRGLCIKICCIENNVNHSSTTLLEHQIIYAASKPRNPPKRVQFMEIPDEKEDTFHFPEPDLDTKVVRFTEVKNELRKGV
ncbi:hypothetical protein WN48_04489 [Eufriesea mexicana]|nr:hypothetical protein WN48_04489 [Eufriesea mexicana]